MAKAYSTNKPSKRQAPQNFLEALRDLGQDMTSEAKVQVRKMVTQDVPESFGFSPSGTLNPNEEVSMNSLKSPEKTATNSELAFTSRLNTLRDEERAMSARQEASIKEQIKSIQDELKQLAKSAGELSQEIERATFQAAVNPGKYHKNFFAHLKNILLTLRKRVTESRNWLAEFNGRSKKQGVYWGQVNKSGSKYMLSSERYTVTSTG